MNFPVAYGEVMGLLDVALLPEAVRQLYETNQVFCEWVHLDDKVRRAEKISCWTQWTREQHAAYKANDFLLFSRMRGYTEDEIAAFVRWTALVAELDAAHGEGFCLDIGYLLGRMTETENLLAIEKELSRMSEEALARRASADVTNIGVNGSELPWL